MFSLSQVQRPTHYAQPQLKSFVKVSSAQQTKFSIKALPKESKLSKISEEINNQLIKLSVPLAGISLPLLLAGSAEAGEGKYGILEGRIFSLIHPVTMGFFFLTSLGAAYTGYQHRRSREIGFVIRDLKKEIPPKPKEAEGEHQHQSQPHPAELEIQKLEQDRKWLTSKNFRDRHYLLGTVILGGGVSIAIYGCVNTYLRLGKLFPGPHLFAGAGIVCCWAIAASLVPYMQKGNEAARTAHIGLNTLNIALFVWQIPTGLAIVEKVLQFTKLP